MQKILEKKGLDQQCMRGRNKAANELKRSGNEKKQEKKVDKALFRPKQKK